MKGKGGEGWMDDRIWAKGGWRQEVKCRPKEVGSRATRKRTRQDVLHAQIQGCEEMIVKIFFFWQEMLKTRKRTQRREVKSDYYGVAENRNGSDLPAGRSWCWGSCLAPWEVVKPFRGYCSTRRTLRNSPSARPERSTGQVCKTRDPSTVICTRAVGALRSLQRQLVS